VAAWHRHISIIINNNRSMSSKSVIKYWRHCGVKQSRWHGKTASKHRGDNGIRRKRISGHCHGEIKRRVIRLSGGIISGA